MAAGRVPEYSTTVYPDQYASTHGVHSRRTWTQVLRQVYAPLCDWRDKERLPFWHGARLRAGGARRNADVEAVTILFLDIDGRLNEALALLEQRQWQAVAFPSPSGREGRGRILIPLAREVLPREYKSLWRCVNLALGGYCDTQTSAVSHGYYVPATRDLASYWVREFTGDLLDPDAFDLADASPPARAATSAELHEFGYEERLREVRAYVATLPEASEGRRHKALLRLAMICRDYALSLDDTRTVVLEYNAEKCAPPEDSERIDKEVLHNIDRYRRNGVGCAVTAAVRVYLDHARTLQGALTVLAERLPDLYFFADDASELIEGEVSDEGQAERFMRVTRDRLNYLLSTVCHWYAYKEGKDGVRGSWHRCAVPQWAAPELLAMPDLRERLRETAGVVNAPTLRRDGSVLAKPGYDKATRVVYLGEPAFIDTRPSADQADNALTSVEALFDQFPFDSEVSRAVYTAYLLTTVARTYINGPIPIGIFDATKAQSGKSLLGKCVGIVMTGRIPPPDEFLTGEEKMTEVLHSRCSSDGRIVFFDNVKNGSVLESHELDAALTSMSVSRRKHYTHTMMSVAFKPIVLATGNGITIGGDMRPRSLYLRLVPHHEHPENRTDLSIPRLAEYVARRRVDICRWLITAWLGWLAAGAPRQVQPWHTFEAWSSVRDVLVWLGRQDPYESRAELQRRDTTSELHEALLDWVAARTNGEGVSASSLLDSLRPKGFASAGGESSEGRTELWALICRETQKRGADVDVRDIGWLLRRFRDAPLAGRRLHYEGGKLGRWYVRKVDAVGEVSEGTSEVRDQATASS